MSEEKEFRPTGWSTGKMRVEGRLMVAAALIVFALAIAFWVVRGGREETPGEGTLLDPAAVSPNTEATPAGDARP